MCNPNDLLSAILSQYADADKWVDSQFEQVKRISNTKVGDVGQDFVERLCRCHGLDIKFPESDGQRLRQSSWDVSIEGVRFELKTATEDISDNFQFNHIRYHRTYDALLCIGISPNEIFFGCWTKAQVTTGQAGRLVSMEKKQAASYKLTKQKSQLWPITEFEDRLVKLVTNFQSGLA